jgi:hypothetical protein
MALYLWLLAYPVFPDATAYPPEPAPVCVAFCEKVCSQDVSGRWHCEEVEYADK